MFKEKIEVQISEREVSFFNDKKNVVKNAPISKIVSAIKSGFFNDKIQEIRESILKKDKDWENLKQALPAFTPCGTFDKVRKIENLSEYSQLVVLDFDDVAINLESSNEFIDIVNKDKHTHCSFISPTGTGFKVLTKVSSQAISHLIAYLQVAQYYEDLTGLKADKSGKDITRLCFFSADERAYYNPESVVFNVVEQREEVMESFASNNHRKTIGPLVGETRFQKAVDLTLHKLPFNEGTRNDFVHLLANNCNRWGMPVSDTVSNILNSDYYYNRKEVMSAIHSAYENIGQHNSFPLKKTARAVADVAVVAQQHKVTGNLFKPFSQLAEEGKFLKPLRQLFGNYILEKSTTLFPSERGVGKSFLAMQIAIKIAQGAKEFLGEKIEINGNVLYINLELGDHTIKKRMSTLLERQTVISEYEAYCFTSRSGLFNCLDDIRGFCNTQKPVLIIIDNLRTAFAGSDNERNKEMTSVITEINKLKDEFNTSFLIVHHTKKGSNNQLTNSDMQSGAGALTDLVDADFFLRKSGVDKNYRILKRVKARECDEQEGAKLITLSPESLWFEFLEEGVDEGVHVLNDRSAVVKENRDNRMIQLIKEGRSDAEIGRQLNVHRSTVGRFREKLNAI